MIVRRKEQNDHTETNEGGEEAYNFRENEDVQAKKFLQESLKKESEGVGHKIFNNYLYDNVKITPDGFKTNAFDVDKKQYSNIVEFIKNKQLDITQAPPRAKELMHYIVNRINDSSHNLFRTVIKLPSSQEVHRELRERISEKDLKSLRNNEKFQSDVLDQLLLVKLRNFFSKSKLT